MASSSDWTTILQLLGGVGGIGGLLAVAQYVTQRRRDSNKERVDLQQVLASSSAVTIETLRAMHRESEERTRQCEERHRQCEERVDGLEERIDLLEGIARVIPTMRTRDEILRADVISSGRTMPHLPVIDWSDVDRSLASRRIRQARDARDDQDL